MSTRVYGCSDDLIEIDGDVSGEVGYHDSSRDEANPDKHMVIADDGTVLSIAYGKSAGAIWAIELIHAGPLFDRIDVCTDEDADPYSDEAWFEAGIKKIWVASGWAEAK